MAPRRRLLVIGQAASPTGFARVLDNLCDQLARDFRIVRLGINYRGEATEGVWRLEPNRTPGDPYGRVAAATLAAELDPDVVLMCHAPWLFSILRPVFSGLRSRLVFYCPIDFPRLGADFAEPLRHVDDLVLYTEEGKQTMCAALRVQDRSSPLPRISVIPHGVDHQHVVLPHANSRREARRRLYPGRPELLDAFIVLNANRNTQRKRVDLTLEAFAEFGRDRQDAFLYLHMGMRDRGTDVRAHARSLGIEKQLLVTTWADQPPAVSGERLNMIYHACDVGLNTSTGEGFGLVAFEHALTGAAQVMPAHASLRSLWGDSALYVPVRQERGAWVVDARDVASSLKRLAGEAGLLASLSAAARHHASRPECTWSEVGRRWRALLQDTQCSSAPGGAAP